MVSISLNVLRERGNLLERQKILNIDATHNRFVLFCMVGNKTIDLNFHKNSQHFWHFVVMYIGISCN